MEDFFAPLSEDELDRLDEFLLDRIDEDDETHDMDEGVLDVSELDGLFTAIVSGPAVIPPSQWLPVVWGDFEPEWDSEEEFGDILSLMIRHMNGIAGALMDQPEDFEPLFLEREVEGKFYTIVDEWCCGYIRGIRLCEEQWIEAGDEINILLTPILVFTSERGWEKLDKSTGSEVENLQKAIRPAIREIHAWWLARRQENGSDIDMATPTLRKAPNVGRNDPCPCGSGKKYKKCCLH